VIVPLAHLGHVLIDAPIFLGPMLLVIGWIWFDGRRRRSRGDYRPNLASGAPHASSDGEGGGTL
jgi:hypothetical protein